MILNPQVKQPSVAAHNSPRNHLAVHGLHPDNLVYILSAYIVHVMSDRLQALNIIMICLIQHLGLYLYSRLNPHYRHTTLLM